MRINAEKDLKQENRNAKISIILSRIILFRINNYRRKLNNTNRNKNKCTLNIRLKSKRLKIKMKNGR